MNEHRAMWFCENVRYDGQGIIDKRTLWLSWCAFADRHAVERGSKNALYQWLFRSCGVKQHAECNWILLRLKMVH
jgi:hypothetical protein